MKLLDDVLGRDSDGTNEQGGLLLDDDIDQLRKLSLCEQKENGERNQLDVIRNWRVSDLLE